MTQLFIVIVDSSIWFYILWRSMSLVGVHARYSLFLVTQCWHFWNERINHFFLIHLILQAIACYTPKFLWDAFEGGLLRMIVMGLNLGICREEEKQAKKNVILSYLTSHLKVNNFYSNVTGFVYFSERRICKHHKQRAENEHRPRKKCEWN